ncbi:MAG: histidinol-phosphate aminotransferase, partial [Halothiobacillaceae bacterium]
NYGVASENLFVGNGSDEVLALAFMAFFAQERPILFPDITYSFYDVYCKLVGVDYQTIPLTELFELQVSDYRRMNGGIIFPNPNAPTGHVVSLAEIEQLLQFNPDSVVVIDEAYIDFGGTTAVPLIHRYPNLLVAQTFSKSRSLAGLRVGYAIGHADLIEGLERIKNSFNSYPLDRLAVPAAIAAVADSTYFEAVCQKIMATRAWVESRLRDLGFELVPSAANFIFIKHPRANAQKLYLTLKQQGVLVRYFDKPRINNHLRITIGTDEEMTIFLARLVGCIEECV